MRSNGERSGSVREWSTWSPLFVGVAWAVGIVAAWRWARGSFVMGSGLMLISVLLTYWPRSIWAPAARGDLPRRWQHGGLLVVCAVAVFFRCYQMDPPGLWGDDAINGLLAFDVLDGKVRSPFAFVDHSFSTFHALSNYLIAGAFLLWGADPLTLRLPGIVVNLLAVPMLYGLVSPLFGPRVALIATLFFASSPFQLGHAKGLLQNILGQSLELAGLCLLVQGTLRGRRWMLIVAGIPIALALYTYHAAKLVPFIAAYVLWQLLRIARGRGIALGRTVIAAAGVALLCAAPALVGYLRHPEALTDRLSGTGLWGAIAAAGSLWPLWDSWWRTLAVFHYQQGPVYHWFGIGTDPGATAVAACFIVHGLVQSLRHWREPRHALLLGWFVLALIPGLLSSEAPRGYRILNAAPVVFVWAALPLARVLSFRAANGALSSLPLRGGDPEGVLGAERPAPSSAVRLSMPKSGRVIAALLVLAVPLVDFNYYFYRVYTSGVFRWFQAHAMVEMARELRSYGPEWTGYLVADNFTRNYESLRFLTRAWQLQVRDVPNLADALPVRDLTGAGALFMIMRTPSDSVMLLQSMYPGIAPDVRYEPLPRVSWFDAWLRSEPPPVPPKTVTFFPVSRRAATDAHGLTGSFLAADGTTLATRLDPQPLVRGTDDLPRSPPDAAPAAVVAWQGSLFAPVEGVYQIRLETTGEASVAIGGGVTATHAAPAATLTLAQGLHSILVAARLAPTPGLRLFWQAPGARETLIPPEAFFRFPARGLLAAYQTSNGLRRRIEPFPYHMFFAEPFPGRYSARWSGRLTVPEPGDYKLSIESDRPVILEIGGRIATGEERLAAGTHTLAVSIGGIEGPPRLRLYWQLADRPRDLIPPQAFQPE